jgi:24-methylenesterol C-methyltransferase
MLKPGGLYVSYEWVKTPKYDKRNPEHVRIVDAICYGDALPEMRTYLEIVDAAKEVGFEVVEERDLALPPAGPWWKRLKMGRLAYYR